MSKILIIDDDQNNRDILRARLEQKGYEVSESPDGEQGLKKAEEIKPDLVLLDAMMPKMDGWHVCREMKGRLSTQAIPVIMLTACDQTIDKLRGWESGADEYVAKPWDPTALMAIVEKWCHAPASQTEGIEKAS